MLINESITDADLECLQAAGDQVDLRSGLTGWGHLPDQWQLANVAYSLFLRQGRVNDGVGAHALLPEGVITEIESTAGR